MTPTSIAANPVGTRARGHGRPVRGLLNATGSSSRDALFGRMFRGLPELVLPDNTTQRDVAAAIAKAMHSENELADITAAQKEQEILTAGGDTEENPAVPAGYTYLGQFIDHDITLDPNSSLQRQNDPDALHNFRTPRLDLDCVYGAGPDDQPYMYDGARLRLGEPVDGAPDRATRDLPRFHGAAIIGDKRNDENVIVSQLQATFLRFHNRMVEDAAATGSGDVFGDAQRMTRWHYQWVVIHDFLVRMCGEAVVRDVLGAGTYVAQGDGATGMRLSPNLHFYDPRQQSFMPVEFSGAVYRFGHSMVRPFYRLNATAGPFATFDTSNDAARSLTGFQDMAGHEVRRHWAIDWSLFFPMSPITGGPLTAARVQPSYQIDTSIAFPLSSLPTREFGESGVLSSLAMRNILRGFTLGLPSGQAVARAMGLTPMGADDIRLGPDATPLSRVAPLLGDNTPLWVYVLAEARANMGVDERFRNTGSGTLGPVAARLVAEVIIGMIVRDRFSFLAQEPGWRPRAGWSDSKGRFGMPQFIRTAQSDGTV